mgnify:CR=1 FL=1
MNRIYFVFFLYSFSVFSQYKIEKEYRVDARLVPQKAVDFIKTFKFDTKVKWYVEESQIGKTYEAKTCFHKQKLSIEFNTLGILIDAEKTINFSRLPASIKMLICQELSSRFMKFQIKKTQLQYVGSTMLVSRALHTSHLGIHSSPVNYELIVKGKTAGTYFKYEMLFDTAGSLIRTLKFSPENTDNLEF